MYADDTVIMSEIREDLQNILDALVAYTKKWNLTVNIDKTKIMVFGNGKKLRDDEIWTYDGKRVDTVNQFNYLGILLNYYGKI